MKTAISNYNCQINANKPPSKNCKLKKKSVIAYLNKKFGKKHNVSIYRIPFSSEKLKGILVHHQGDMLRALNSNIHKENKKETPINTLRPDLRFLVKLKVLEKKILTFSSNFGEFKGKLCIYYKVSSIAHELIEAYFSITKTDLIKKIKEEKDTLRKNKESSKPQNIIKNVTVYNKKYININDKNSIESSLFKRIKSIILNTKKPIRTLKNALSNYKDFKNYLKHDYEIKDIKEFFLSKLNLYKHKIRFMRKVVPYKTDFYILARKFKDNYITKWKSNKIASFLGYAGIIANNILSNILTKGLKFEQ
ncbi:plasmid maintenance protein [Borreliella burgdorferi]|uniref:plasmid maintenance protein n=1 Tax=Borreliella burgdorferi TaxID=139 RepID=UPI0027059510|nr:plasmid maintenance protein [Borreliella burgdorferi]MDO7272892.1 plasmid maintenance protein [Borreliella burgdorferi]